MPKCIAHCTKNHVVRLWLKLISLSCPFPPFNVPPPSYSGGGSWLALLCGIRCIYAVVRLRIINFCEQTFLSDRRVFCKQCVSLKYGLRGAAASICVNSCKHCRLRGTLPVDSSRAPFPVLHVEVGGCPQKPPGGHSIVLF